MLMISRQTDRQAGGQADRQGETRPVSGAVSCAIVERAAVCSV